MKNSLILIILIFGLNLYGQSDSTEKAILYNKMLSKEIEQSEFSRIATKWNQTMKEIKKYPDLPLDQSGQVHYSFLNIFGGLNKEKLFTRTLEWLSVNYGLFPQYIYTNPEEGKIIIRNSLNLSSSNSCTYAAVISIKNEKVLVEITNIGYQMYFEGYYSNDSWIPEKTINVGINQIYPIIMKNPVEWNSKLVLLKSTNELFSTENGNLYHYIINYNNTDSF
jgi:hypothetical protein